jgi:hypothetical protein
MIHWTYIVIPLAVIWAVPFLLFAVLEFLNEYSLTRFGHRFCYGKYLRSCFTFIFWPWFFLKAIVRDFFKGIE